jgi:hypothetical protein
MASTIKNLHEVSGTPLLKERCSQIRSGITGLGPEDLVILDKTQQGFLRSHTTELYYHTFSGFKLSPSSFISYYLELLRRQEQASRLPLTKSYRISRGRFLAWNSFDCCDVRVTINCPPSYSSKVVLPNGTDRPAQDSDWPRVQLSSALRSFRAARPLLLSLFGHRAIPSPALQTYHTTPLRLDEFRYILDNHCADDDLAASLAAGALLSLELSELRTFISISRRKLPTIFGHLWKYISPDCRLAAILAPLAEDHFRCFCDDSDLAFRLFEFHILRGGPTNFLVPFLRNAMWAEPMAAVCLAQTALAGGEFARAFNYLNASFFCCHWPSRGPSSHCPMLTNPATALPFHSPGESRIVSSPLVGVQASTFLAAARLVESVTATAFNDFVKVMTEGRVTANQLTSFATWPPPCRRMEVEEEELLLLYDPGIEAEDCGGDVIEKLPYADGFKNMLTDVQHALDRKRDVLAGKETQSKKSAVKGEDAFSVVALGLRLRSRELVEKGMQMARERPGQASSTVKLLLLKAQMCRIGPELDAVLGMSLTEMFLTDMNALAFVENMALAVDHLCAK